MSQEIYTLYKAASGEVLPAMVHSENVEKFLEIGFYKTEKEAEQSMNKQGSKK